MNTNNGSDRQKTLKTALTVAVELVADMDRSLFSREGIVTVVPEVIVWMMKESSPELFREIDGRDLRESLVSLLDEYAALRMKAQQRFFLPAAHSTRESDCEAQRLVRITYDDLLNALSTSAVSPEFRHVFASILPDVEEKLELIDAIPWGDEEIEDSPAWNVDTTPLFDHYSRHRKAEQLRDPIANSTEPLELAKIWLKSTLEAMDDGRHPYFWSTVYTSVLGEWFQTTSPSLAKSVEAAGLIPAFYDAAGSYVATMRDIERRWHRLSEPLCKLVSNRTGSADEAIEIIASMLDINARQETERIAIARQVYDMFCRRLNPERTAKSCKLFASPASNPLIEMIRQDPASWETCYLVDTSALPMPFAERVTERQCLVVRLPEARLQLLNELADDTGLTGVFSKMSDGSQRRFNLTVNHAFWAPREQLWHAIFRFRNEVPVLYLFADICILARYHFNHFVDLRRVADVPYRNWDSATLDDGEWRYAARHYQSELPDGTQVKPAILTTVTDLTSPTSLSDWTQVVMIRPETVSLRVHKSAHAICLRRENGRPC
ncbi:hypothetical protein [Trinickia mobilis]|uniref:hypothetical protein n=1 Tax=Trinickia mobilis TaxID=2816356 RepID=UPI001A8CB473|nr:hypothetical protein [Trinickia mobilis]